MGGDTQRSLLRVCRQLGSCQDPPPPIPPAVPHWPSEHRKKPGNWKLENCPCHTEPSVDFAAAQASQAAPA